jgi:hypothetical protein
MLEHMDLNTGMAIVADAIDEVLAATEPLVLGATPLDQSPGLSELAQEKRFRATPTSTPVINTYAYASLQGYGAVDGMRALSTLLRAPRLPVWAPLVNARAGVDAAAQMFWLIEPDIGVQARVQRGMALRLHSARQQRRAPAEATSARALARTAIEGVRVQATALGWSISGKDQQYARVGDESFPHAKEAIDRVLRHRQPDQETMADLTWWFYSGITHATPVAFAQFISATEATDSGIPGLCTAPIYVDGRQFVAAARTLGRATINATLAYSMLLGRDTTDLEKAERQLTETVVGAFQAMGRHSAQGPASS